MSLLLNLGADGHPRRPLNRRTFLRRFALGSATSFLLGNIWSSRVLGTILDGPAGVLKMKVSDFPALLTEGGSIQLTVTGSSPHPLMINRGAGDTFYTLDSDCQHQHCVVPPYDRVAGHIRCNCHGSLYAIDGSLLGGPAQRGLNTFASTFDGVDTLRVTIPGIFFSTQVAVQSASRLRLTFDIRPYSTYQVHFGAELTDTFQVIPFASTPGGITNLTSAFTTISPVSVYVDATTSRGFYAAALLATPY